jgi:hypothetical protein
VKTQIIQLNTRDDYISIRDKMDWSQARRILLVWPSHARAPRKLDLGLLRLHAISLGCQLAVATKDASVKFYAHQASLPAFSNILQAQNSEWEPLKRTEIAQKKKSEFSKSLKSHQGSGPSAPAWWENPAVRVLSFSISLLAFLSLVGFIMPGATVTITPKVESQSMIFDILADPSTAMINYSSGSIPTYNLKTVVKAEESIHTSGTIAFPDRPAIGKLSFTNASGDDIIIPAGTIVTTQGKDPIRFMTTSNQETTVKPGQTVQLEAQAMKPGLSGNLAEDQLVVIQGLSPTSLTVTNLIPTTGGTQINIPAPNSQDQASVRNQLLIKLEQSALEKMQTQLAEEYWIITPTLRLVETLSEIYYPEVGEPGNNLKLAMEVRFEVQVVPDDLLHLLTEPIMDANTPKGYLGVPNSLAFSPTDQPIQVNDGKAHIRIRATRAIRAQIPEMLVTQRILGSAVTEAIKNLSASIPLADQAQIILFPKWWPRLPWLGIRIEVIQTDIYENISR